MVITALTSGLFVSLHSDDPGPTGTSEIGFGGYGRVGGTTFSNSGSDPTTASNSSIIAFSPASADWGQVSYVGLWDALSGGNFRGSGPLTDVKTIQTADSVRFAVGALTIPVD